MMPERCLGRDKMAYRRQSKALHPSAVVQKCANSLCAERFRSLRQGRLFSFHDGSRVRHLWLCFICTRRFDLVRGAEGEYRLVRKRKSA
jgi:hypothetical protein